MTGIEKVTFAAKRYDWAIEKKESSKDVTLLKGNVRFDIATRPAGSIATATWNSPGRDPIVITGAKKVELILTALVAPVG